MSQPNKIALVASLITIIAGAFDVGLQLGSNKDVLAGVIILAAGIIILVQALNTSKKKK